MNREWWTDSTQSTHTHTILQDSDNFIENNEWMDKKRHRENDNEEEAHTTQQDKNTHTDEEEEHKCKRI